MKTIKIGKNPDNDIRLPEKDSISRNHLTITLDDKGRYTLEDHSLNGTKVNGKLIKRTKVPLRFDSTVFVEGIKLPWLSYFKDKNGIPDSDEGDNKPAPPVPSPQPPAPEPADIDTYDLSTDFQAEYNALKNSITLPVNNYKAKLSSQKKTTYHSFSDELFFHAVESYNQSFADLAEMLETASKNSMPALAKFDRDMQLLNRKMFVSLQRNASGISAIEQRKNDITKQFAGLKNETRRLLSEITESFEQKHPLLFDNQYEMAEANSSVWNKLERRNPTPASTVFAGKNSLEFTLFDEKFTVRKNEYLSLLNTQNLVVRYNSESKQKCLNFINTLAGRLLAASESGELSISMIDAEEMDGTCDVFKRLSKTIFSIYAREEEIVKHLEETVRHIENVIQNVLHGSVRSLADYNQSKENKEGYRLLIIKGFPAGIGGRAATLLKKILKNGVRAGVNVLLLVDEDEIARTDENQKAYNSFGINTIGNCAIYDFIKTDYSAQNYDTVQYLNFETLNDEQLLKIVLHTNKGFETRKEEAILLADHLLPQTEWWSRHNANVMTIPFGTGENLGTESLLFSQISGQNAAIVIGRPGSGKSVLLNTVITNAALHYSPDELELYLIDFSGVEFNIYAEHALPHAKVIAPESEREFGISILRKIKNIANEREIIFRDAKVKNIVEYREKKPELPMPRILIIIDEFQKFFQTSDDGKSYDQIYQDAQEIVNIIIREYRKYGINLILATQSMRGLHTQTIGLDMIANRIVFDCLSDDASLLLPKSEGITTQLKVGECIYNSRSGEKSDNKKVRTFYADDTEQNRILEEIRNFAGIQGKPAKDMIVFRSAEIPVPEFEKQFEIIAQKAFSEGTSVWLGKPIELSQVDARAVLRNEGAANLLIIGGDQNIAITTAINCTQSLVISHVQNQTPAQFYFFNFMRKSDPLFAKAAELYDNDRTMPFERHFIADNTAEITSALKTIKEIIDLRQSDKSIEQEPVYLSFYDMQPNEAISGGSRPSDAWNCLDHIVKYGSAVGVFVIMHIADVQRLKQVFSRSANPAEYFNHRVVLQMSRDDSYTLLNNRDANTLSMDSRPHTKNRAYYFNPKENIFKKFKPYQIYKS